jgi:hypothetical protein
MRRSRLAIFKCALFVGLLASAVVASAQEQQQTAAARAPERLVVQVEYFKGEHPAYVSVPNGSWFGRFGTTPAAASRAADDTVLAVDVKTRAEGGRVEIKVGVHVGARHFERLDEVATYYAAAGETVVARDLERFGVAPFTLKVLRVGGTAAGAPTVVNRTQSVEAAVTDFTPEPLPRARLRLRNLSSKRVVAVELREVLGGRERTLIFEALPDGNTLMEPGGTHERRIGMTTGSASGEEFTPQAVESVVVASAVFDDYTYEGDAHAAARKRANDEGERAQLPRLLALLRETRGAAAATPGAVQRLKAKLSALGADADARSVDAIMKGYSELKPSDREMAESSMSVAMHRVRRELLDDLARFEADYARDPAANDFAAWLEAKRERFEQWLARL